MEARRVGSRQDQDDPGRAKPGARRGASPRAPRQADGAEPEAPRRAKAEPTATGRADRTELDAPQQADRSPRRAGRPRKDEAGDTRATLLSAALDLFVEKGFAATSVRMIAREAGLSDGGLYAHFATKQAIYDELMARKGPDTVDDMLDLLLPDRSDVPEDPEAFLREAVGRLLDYFTTPEAMKFSRLLLREEIPTHPELVSGMVDKAAIAFAPLFETWANRGLLSPAAQQTDSATLTWELLAPLGFVRLVYLHGPDGLRREGERKVRTHLEFFLAATFGR